MIHPRDAIVQTMDRIYRYRMTTTSGGNISIRDEQDNIWISPARVDKGNLSRNDVVCIRRDGTVEGVHAPSSEFPFHHAIFQARSDIRAIVHAHPVALVAFSICRQTPNTRMFHQSYSVCGKIGFAPYACPGSDLLGENIARTFQSGCDSVILENHGVVVGGTDLSNAFQRFEAFEFAGKTIIEANQLGKVRYLSDDHLHQATRRRVDFQTFEHDHPTSEELELRSQLCRFLHRGCRQRLFISTEGSFSARLNDDSFLLTPTQRDRETLNLDDLVFVRGHSHESGKRVSRAVRAHQSIYAKHPEVGAIVFAHPVHATAFSVTDATFDARTIPESYVFLRDVARVPYGMQYFEDGRIAEFVSSKSPAAILENDGVLVTGKNVLDVFDRLEVLESSAEAIIESRSIGQISRMSEEVIEELQRVFHL